MAVFRFKHFELDDSRCAMKIGSDSVLLGAWVPLPEEGTILDIGCGCGIISMMMAQRNPVLHINGVEIDPDAASQAIVNAQNSPFRDSLAVILDDIRQYARRHHQCFDLIVSNPPYFQQSLKSPAQPRNDARHDTSLDHTELLEAVEVMLKKNGAFCLVLPADVFPSFRLKAAGFGLYPSAIHSIHHSAGSLAIRVLAQFNRQPRETVMETTLCIMEEDHRYTPAYLQLTKDFYLFA